MIPALLLVLIAAPANGDNEETMVDRVKGAGRVVQGGVLTTSGRAALRKAAKRIAAPAAVTVVVCTGSTQQIEATAGRRVARSVRRLVRAEVPGLSVSTVIREARRADCPAGVLLERRRVSPRGGLLEARTISAAGAVKGVRPDGNKFPLAAGSVIPAGSEIITGPSGRCTILLPSGTEVRVQANSRLALNKLADVTAEKPEGASLKLFAGRMWSQVSGFFRDSDSDMQVQTDNSVVGIRGTTFVLNSTEAEWDAPASTGLGVYDGDMEMEVGDHKTEVPAGYALAAKGTKVGKLRALPPAPTGLQPQQGLFISPVIVAWLPVQGSVGYRLEVAKDVQFKDLQFLGKFKSNLIEVEAPPGTYFWRVVSFDDEGFESRPSKLYRIELAPPPPPKQ